MVTNLEFVQTIQIGSCFHLTTNSILSLTNLQHLTRLEACGNNRAHDLITAISRLQNLKQLRFAACDFTPGDAKYLSGMTNLVELHIPNPMTLGTNGLLSLTNLTHLEILAFGGANVPDDLVDQFYKSRAANTLKISR